MIRARNTTTGAEFEAPGFDGAFMWGVTGLPGPHGELEERAPTYKTEFEEQGRTCFTDRRDRTSAETVELWNPDVWGEVPPEW